MKKIILIIALLLATCCLYAQNWITTGGNNLRNGQTNCTGCTELNQLWSYQYDEPTAMSYTGYISNDKIVTTHLLVDWVNAELSAKIMCFDILSGELLWEHGDPWQNVFIALGFNENHVYAVDHDNNEVVQDFYSIDATTGEVEWILDDTIHCGAMDWWYPVFTDDGNIIASQDWPTAIICIDKNDGSILWENTDWSFPVTGGAQQSCIVGNRIYGLDGLFMEDLTIVTFDSDTGNKLCESESLDPNTDQQIPITVSSDGKVFVMLQDGGVVAYQDTGNGFTKIWDYPEIGGHRPVGPLCNFGLSQDNQCFYVTDGNKILKINANTGELIAQSSDGINGKFITVDCNDNLFVSNLGYDDGCYYCLDSELNTIWHKAAPFNSDSGISIGGNNIMIVPMCDSIVAYQAPISVDDEPISQSISYAINYPNPLHEQTVISYFLKKTNRVTVDILNIKGQQIKNLNSSTQNTGEHSVAWYGKDEYGNPVAPGIYLYRIVVGDETVIRKMILMK